MSRTVIDFYYDEAAEAESQNEAAAAHQMALDALYRIGCQYDSAKADMALLCQLAGVSVDEFMKYTGATVCPSLP